MKCGNCKNLMDGWCNILYDSPDPDLERECVSYKLMTNYDRIKQMSVEEMAEFISHFTDGYHTPAQNKRRRKDMIKWLEQEVEE